MNSDHSTMKGIEIIMIVGLAILLAVIAINVMQNFGWFPKQDSLLTTTDVLIQQATETPGLRVRVVLLDIPPVSYTGRITRLTPIYLCLMDEATEPNQEVCVQQKAIGATVFLQATEEAAR